MAPKKPKEMFPGDASLDALEKLDEAVRALATGAGQVQERVYRAVICLHPISLDSIPDEEVRRVLAGIKDDLTFDVPKDKEGRIVATLRGTSDEDAVAVAGRILDLYLRLYHLLLRSGKSV